MVPEEFKNAYNIIDTLERSGYEAFFVGGSVRDYLMNNQIADIDITTNATPEEIIELFTKTIPTGIEHGTVTVVTDKGNYEITTYRTESTYINYRKPENVKFVRELKEDLKRRDFTMNAIAMTKDGQLKDFYNGFQHIKNKQICAVGIANERFQEDALRIIRGLRFQSTLGFNIVDDTYKAIVKHHRLLKEVAIERVNVELNKLVKGKYLIQTLIMIRKDLLLEALPFFKYINQSDFNLLINILNELTVDEHNIHNTINGRRKKVFQLDYNDFIGLICLIKQFNNSELIISNDNGLMVYDEVIDELSKLKLSRHSVKYIKAYDKLCANLIEIMNLFYNGSLSRGDIVKYDLPIEYINIHTIDHEFMRKFYKYYISQYQFNHETLIFVLTCLKLIFKELNQSHELEEQQSIQLETFDFNTYCIDEIDRIIDWLNKAESRLYKINDLEIDGHELKSMQFIKEGKMIKYWLNACVLNYFINPTDMNSKIKQVQFLKQFEL